MEKEAVFPMGVPPTYPGVYVEEVPNGHTIRAVDTSVTAFVGLAKQGPLNKAVRVRSFPDYELAFSGLDLDSEMSFAVHQFFLNGGSDAWIVRVADAVNPTLTESDLHSLIVGDRTKREGLYALESVGLLNLLCIPGVAEQRVLHEAEGYCRERRAFLIVDSPFGSKSPSQIATDVKDGLLPQSDSAAVFFPWVLVADPFKAGAQRSCAPSGAVAGLFARNDATRGVWKAPAGVDAQLVGVHSVALELTTSGSDALNQLGVNCLRVFPGHGVVCWGSRTLRGADQLASEWKYIPVRRTAWFIEESIYRGTEWVVFEPNDETLWARVRKSVTLFLHELFRAGAFQGSTPQEAYFVKCGPDTMSHDDIDNGIVNIVVGFAPLRPAEFVIVRVQVLLGHREN